LTEYITYDFSLVRGSNDWKKLELKSDPWVTGAEEVPLRAG
jgi:hypothetical protein